MFPAKASKKVKGRTKYYIRYWEGNKLKTLPVKLTGDLWSKAEALKWIKRNQDSDEISHIKGHSEGLKWLKWKNDYANINKLLEEFVDWHKEKAPNSYMTTAGYLERYVMRFFLDVQEENQLKFWCRHHKNFKKWLKDDAFKVGTETPIAYSTKNHCIRAYNNFMRFLKEESYIDHHQCVPCESFAEHLVRKSARGYKDIVSEKEFKELVPKLQESRDFTILLYHTGMRFNELLSLPFCNVYEDDDGLPDFMRERFRELSGDIYGYLLLKDQSEGKVCQRDEKTGHITRKPLKGRKEISFKDARIIPITDEECWNVIVENYNKALESFEGRVYKSSNEEDYLLIDIPMNRIRRDFFQHCKKGFHALRHSFATRLIASESGGDTRIVRAITGHKSEQVFDRYNHIYEEYALNASKKKKKRKSKLKLIKSKLDKVG